MKKLLVLLASLPIFWSSSTFAADSQKWTFSIVPFFWGVNITGDIEVGVPEEGIENQLLHISENFLGLMSHVHSGGMLDVTAMKGNFGLFASGMYANIKSIIVTTSGGFEVSVNSKFGLFTAGAFYFIFDQYLGRCSRVRIGPYIGGRYTANDSSAGLVEAPELNSSYAAHWTEPIVGATMLFDINKYWVINVSGDLGFLRHNQESYNVIGLVGLRPNEHLTLYLGYRELYQSFTEGSGPSFFEWKMHTGGPIIGLAFIF